MNFSPFPEIKIDNYVLRKVTQDDAAEIFILRSDDTVLKYLDIEKTNNIAEAEQFISKINTGIYNNEWIYWVICENNSPRLIGTICLWNFSQSPMKADIGFILLPEFHGKKIMKKIIPAVLNYGFNKLKLEFIEGEVDPGNIKSIKLMERFGFTFVCKLEKTEIFSFSQNDYQRLQKE